jgi:hypothetical protein
MIIPKPLIHTLLVLLFRQPEVAVVSIFQTIPGTFQHDPTVSSRALPEREGNHQGTAVVTMTLDVGQDIEKISLIPDGRSGGGIKVGIGGEAA